MMANIERAEWQISVCRDCGRHEDDPVDPCVCEPDGPKVMFSVKAVDAANLKGAVDALREIERQTPRLPATDPVTGEPSPWTIAADYFADFGGR